MRRFFLIIGVMMLTASACKKNQPAPVTAEEVPPPPAPAPEVKQTEVAQGEIKDLLLALKRVHFPFDSNVLTDESKAALDEAGEKLRKYLDIQLYVDGHTDDRGTTEYNMSLGERRAQAVVEYLANSGVEKARLTIVSFGEEKPLASGKGDVANAKNRRVDFRLMKGDIQFVLEDSDLVDDKGTPISGDAAPAPAAPQEPGAEG